MNTPIKAAVIGASGIGKNHANWLHDLGADVAAFAGSSPQSVERTAQTLKERFGFSGRGYWDVGEMLAEERPDVVVVSSPPALHLKHAVACLSAGAHVMCEKPIVWSSAPAAVLRQDARIMAQAACDAERILTFNTQYVAAVPAVREIAGDDGPAERVFFELESKGAGGEQEYEEIFIDLAPHPISFLLAAAPGAQPLEESFDCRIAKKEVIIELDCARPDGGVCHARFELRNKPPDAALRRRMGVNDCVVEYQGRNNERGVFRTYLKRGAEEFEFDDFVYTNMKRFLEAAAGRGAPLVSLEEGIRAFDLFLRLYELRHRTDS